VGRSGAGVEALAMRLEKTVIQRRIKELDHDLGWDQDIDLGGGLHTKSRVIWGEDRDHPWRRWERIEPAVPPDLTGMSVFDMACNAGFFAFEAKKRGADYVCGIDLKPGYIEQARFCADVMGVDISFQTSSIYELEKLDRRFDLVFCGGILFHCKYLALALDQVAKVTKDRVIVESAIDPMESEIPYVRFVCG
jgi:tRNA (mo5U34)-methyltransferase